MTHDLTTLSKKAVEKILSLPSESKIRVVSHYDADGITAAAIICKMLYRAGYDFHCTLMRNPFTKGFDRLKKEENDLIIFTDMGSGQIDTIEEIECKSIIIDHHQFIKEKTKENVFQINANMCGINGNYEACGATLAYSIAKEASEKNIDLLPLAITGLTGDKQYIGGIKGYNKRLVDDAVNNNQLSSFTGLKLSGENIFESLFYSIDPFYSGISGDKKSIRNLLKNFGISEDKKYEEITDKQKEKLNSYLMLILIKKGVEKNILDTVIRRRFIYDKFDCELEFLADLLDSCGKSGNRGLGLSVALGSKDSFEKAINLSKDFKQKILDKLLELDKNGAEEKKSFRYFYSKDSSLGGVIGGIATNFIFDKTKPLISIVKNDDEIHVSCRGNQHLVKRGLDLGLAMKTAAEKLKGHGGGHSIAAGGTFDLGQEEEFLEIVQDVISKQLKG